MCFITSLQIFVAHRTKFSSYYHGSASRPNQLSKSHVIDDLTSISAAPQSTHQTLLLSKIFVDYPGKHYVPGCYEAEIQSNLDIQLFVGPHPTINGFLHS